MESLERHASASKNGRRNVNSSLIAKGNADKHPEVVHRQVELADDSALLQGVPGAPSEQAVAEPRLHQIGESATAPAVQEVQEQLEGDESDAVRERSN